MKLFTEFLKDDSGATAIEYGLIAAAVGLVLVTIAPQLSAALTSVFGEINSGLNTAAANAQGN